jgi:ADP-heptose:LPS heptosyltransferase
MLPIRKWGEANFVSLANRLLAENEGVWIVFTGSPSERSACETMAAEVGSPRAVSVAGMTSMEELIALYWIADVLVTNDSGPGHFASLSGIKSVVMFGPETPALFGPLGNNATVVFKRLACSPCVSAYNQRETPCTDNLCMQLIGVDEIADIVNNLLRVADKDDGPSSVP